MVTSDTPTKTEKLPVMKALDGDTVLVEYADSFVIEDFSLIKTLSGLVENNNVGVATRENITTVHGKWGGGETNEVYQTLEENVKIKAKLNSCKNHKFVVRITFPGGPEYLDSLQANYTPESFKEVSES